MAVRPETGEDVEAMRAVHLAAFRTSAEADLVARLNRDCDSEISLVAEQAGGVGSELVRSALGIAVTLGEEVVFVLGEP